MLGSGNWPGFPGSLHWLAKISRRSRLPSTYWKTWTCKRECNARNESLLILRYTNISTVKQNNIGKIFWQHRLRLYMISPLPIESMSYICSRWHTCLCLLHTTWSIEINKTNKCGYMFVGENVSNDCMSTVTKWLYRGKSPCPGI